MPLYPSTRVIASPTLTGDPVAPTATAGDADTSVATTAFVTTAVSARAAIAGDLGGTAASPQVTGTHLAAALPLAQGGTAATDAAGARSSLELGTAATMTPATLAADTAFTGAYAPISADDRAVTPFGFGGVGDGVADDTTAVNSALSSGHAKVVFPAGTTWNMASPAVQPNGVSVVIEPGCTIRATAAMTNGLWQIGTEATAAEGGFLRGGGTIDANDLAVDALEVVRAKSFVIDGIYADNQTTGAAFHIGRRGAWASSYEMYLTNCHSRRTDGNVAQAGSKGLWVDWCGDSVYNTMTFKGAGKTGVEVNFSGNRFVNIHPWGPNGNLPDYSFHDTHYRNEYVMCAADTPAIYGWYLEAQYTVIIGGNCYISDYGPDNTVIAVYATHSTPTYYAYGVTMEGKAAHRIARDYYGTGSNSGTDGCHIMPGSQAYVQTATLANAARMRPFSLIESSSIAMTIRDATSARYFGVDTTNPGEIWVANGKILRGYSGSMTGETWRIDASKGTIRPAALTTAGRNALTSLGEGDTVYDTTLHLLVTWDGSAWRNQAGTVV